MLSISLQNIYLLKAIKILVLNENISALVSDDKSIPFLIKIRLNLVCTSQSHLKKPICLGRLCHFLFRGFIREGALAAIVLKSKVINVGSDTLGNPVFHEGLQN